MKQKCTFTFHNPADLSFSGMTGSTFHVSTFSLLRSFVCKCFPARISSHSLNPPLLSLPFFFICLRYWGWFTDHKHCYEKTGLKPGALLSMPIGRLETHNALWRHYSGWHQAGHQPSSIDLWPRENHTGLAMLVRVLCAQRDYKPRGSALRALLCKQ